MWKRITDSLAFTRTERNVLFFLVGAFLFGTGIQLFQTDGASAAGFDYSPTDSAFFALSSGDSASWIGEAASLVNINSASREELIALPGIGEVTAERIILRREDVGPFTTPEDLLSVKGISKRKLETLKPLITIQ
jgi:competence protein ComEA